MGGWRRGMTLRHTSKTNSQHTPPLPPLPMLSAIILFGESVDTSGLGWESRMTAERKKKKEHTPRSPARI